MTYISGEIERGSFSDMRGASHAEDIHKHRDGSGSADDDPFEIELAGQPKHLIDPFPSAYKAVGERNQAIFHTKQTFNYAIII